MLERSTLDLHRQLIELAERMPPLPTSVTRLGTVVGDPDTTVDAVCDVLRDDPGLVVAILREANSAASAARDAVATIETGVVRLGMARVLAVAVVQTVHDELNAASPTYGLAEGILYRHSVAVSHVAEVMQPLSRVALGPELVTAALLHDLGMIVLGQMLSRPSFEAAHADEPSIVAVERQLADVDHAELGAFLAKLWKLPDSVTDGIRFHHFPAEGENDLAWAIALADSVADDLLAEELRWSEQPDRKTADAAAERLGVDFDELRARSSSQLRKAGLILAKDAA